MIEVLNLISTAKLDFRTYTESEYIESNHTTEDCRRMACAVLRMAGQTNSALRCSRPLGMTIGADGLLYVSSRGLDSVLRFNLSNGTLIDEFRLPNGPLSPHGLAIGPNGRLYVGSESENCIVSFDVANGGYLGRIVSLVQNPVGLAVGTEGDLYVACCDSCEVRRYHSKTGALLSTWTTHGNGRPTGLTIGPDGDLFVACGRDRVVRYALRTSEFRGVFASGGGLEAPTYIAFGPDGNLYVAGRDSGAIHRYNGQSGEFIGIVSPQATLVCPEGGSSSVLLVLCMSTRWGKIFWLRLIHIRASFAAPCSNG